MLFRRRPKKGKNKKPHFDFRTWADVDRIKESGAFITSTLKCFFIPQKAANPETLETVMRNLKLSKEDLEKRRKALYRLSLFMLLLTLCLFVYFLFLLMGTYYRACLITFGITSIALALSFRYHFWYFQITKGKLGCTFREWFKEGLLGK